MEAPAMVVVCSGLCLWAVSVCEYACIHIYIDRDERGWVFTFGPSLPSSSNGRNFLSLLDSLNISVKVECVCAVFGSWVRKQGLSVWCEVCSIQTRKGYVSCAREWRKQASHNWLGGVVAMHGCHVAPRVGPTSGNVPRLCAHLVMRA